MKNSSNYHATLLSILALLSFSTVIPALAYAAPLANNDKDWQYVNGNSWAWNYSPQTQLNKDNVQNLEVKWLFPLGSKALAPKAMQLNPYLAEGATAPPIVRDGLVYVLSNWGRMYAVEANSGKQKWTHDYVIDITELRKTLPLAASSLSHNHGFRYWEGGDAILAYGMACDFYGVNAKTGEKKIWVKDLCKDVPGNLGIYQSSVANSANIATYEKGRQFIIIQPSRIHSNVAEVAPRDSRHVTLGVSMDAPYNILWRVYSSPPQDKPVKDWALQECDIGYFREMPCKDVAAVNQAGLEWDFALPNQPIGWFAGVTANWGQPVVDEATGLMYTQTGNQGPYSNMTLAPGPRLYGSTIMAIDLNAGKRVWWLQPFPHDPYDYDCNWSGMLTENPTLGKVYVYGCKEGRYYAMDAATGKPKLTVDVVLDQVARGQIEAVAAKPRPDGIRVYMPDPKSYYDMREWNWISYPAKAPGEPGKYCTLPCTVYPNWTNGVFQTDRALDPETQTYILYEGALWATILAEHSYFPGERNYKGGNLFTTLRDAPTNTTLVARDMATGKVKWSWYYDYSSQRAAPIVSGGMVITAWTDGFMRFFDKDTGKALHQLPVGAGVVVQPTIGKDANGNSKIFAVIGATSTIAAGARYGLSGDVGVPGTLIALGLSEKPSAGAGEVKTTTVTTISSTTITTTSVSTSGLPAEVTYAAVAVAVIAIIGAAVLLMRKK